MGVETASIDCQPTGPRGGTPGQQKRCTSEGLGSPCMCAGQRGAGDGMWVITKGVTPSYALSASLPARQLFSWAILPPVLSSGTVL